MKTRNLIIPVALTAIFLTSCDKFKKNEIVHETLNKEYVVKQDVDDLQNSNDEISLRIDSILDGEIQAEFISTGYQSFSIDEDDRMDIAFEIVNLQPFNQNNLPEELDSLAARVIPLREEVEILDNSTYGYPDALGEETEIDASSGAWDYNERGFVLGTFAGAGNFSGMNHQYLAYRIKEDGGYNYGWFKLYCSDSNDHLKVISHALNLTTDKGIEAGETD